MSVEEARQRFVEAAGDEAEAAEFESQALAPIGCGFYPEPIRRVLSEGEEPDVEYYNYLTAQVENGY